MQRSRKRLRYFLSKQLRRRRRIPELYFHVVDAKGVASKAPRSNPQREFLLSTGADFSDIVTPTQAPRRLCSERVSFPVFSKYEQLVHPAFLRARDVRQNCRATRPPDFVFDRLVRPAANAPPGVHSQLKVKSAADRRFCAAAECLTSEHLAEPLHVYCCFGRAPFRSSPPGSGRNYTLRDWTAAVDRQVAPDFCNGASSPPSHQVPGSRRCGYRLPRFVLRGSGLENRVFKKSRSDKDSDDTRQNRYSSGPLPRKRGTRVGVYDPLPTAL